MAALAHIERGPFAHTKEDARKAWFYKRFRKPFVVFGCHFGCLKCQNWRGWMGIAPTQDASQRPANGFEDRGRHQPPYIPSPATLAARRVARRRRGDAFRPQPLGGSGPPPWPA